MNRILTIALTILAFAATAWAEGNNQNVAKGFQADKTYEIGQLDAINLFNGNLNVTIPIGQTYVVSPTLSYSFKLVYSGNNWTMESFPYEWTEVLPPPHEPVKHEVIRSAYFPGADNTGHFTADRVWSTDNAGFGWRLSLGSMSVNKDAPFTVFAGGTYHSPDGGKHEFWPVLHKAEVETDTDDPTVGYTNDGSYLRLRRLEDHTWEIDFPNGNIHTFDNNGTLIKMRDAFDNAVTFSFQRNAQTNIATWRVIDPYRSHTFTFVDVTVPNPGLDRAMYPILKTATLAGFDGNPALYEFKYVDGDTAVPISRRWGGGRKTVPDCIDTISPTVRVPLLEEVVQPDLSTVELTYDRGDNGATFSDPMGGTEPFTDIEPLLNTDGSRRICNRSPGFSGTLKRLKMPAGGSVDWDYLVWAYPENSSKKAIGCGQPPPPLPQLSPCNTEGGYDAVVGVKTRIEYDRDQSILSKRTYSATTDPTPVDWKTQITTVTSYSSEGIEQKTLHYYSVDGKDTSPKGRTQGHYGLPYSREADLDTLTPVANPGPANATTTGFLSTKTYDASDNLLSYTYVLYEGDDATFEAGAESNRRMHTEINVDVVDGTTTWTTTRHTGFDGLGHYRNTETTGSLTSDPVRKSTTNYNPNVIYPGENFVIPDDWVLNTFDRTSVEETRDGVTDGRSSEYCFEASTGFLMRTRTLRGTAPGETDLLSVFTPELVNGVATGQVQKESHYGGDAPNPGAVDTRLNSNGFETCSGTPGTAAFEITHQYEFGVRRESQYVGASFKTLDLAIDKHTGLVKEAKDPLSSRSSKFRYDSMGRILELRPPGQSWTKYEYSLANGKAIARQYATDVAYAESASATALTESHFYYDGLGRLVQQKSRAPEGWTTTGHTWDWLARKQSSWVSKVFSDTSDRTDSIAKASTTFDYDARGRLETTTAPDGSKVSQAYPTARSKTRKVKIATVAHPEGEEVTTTETYDIFGRLVQVSEPSGTDGAQETTDYSYDAGNNLKKVDTPDQDRTFDYDGAGLLVEEDHPETAATTYRYDARGHVTKKCIGGCDDAAVELEYAYDEAERLLTVFDAKAAKTLKSLTYDDTELGRLATQARHNHFADGTYVVKDTFTYEETTGRPAKKVTDITVDPPDSARPPLQFVHNYDYNALGAPDHIKYPTCAACGTVAGNERNIALQYQYGHLTGITGVTAPLNAADPQDTAITYTPAGAVERVQHAKANGDPGVTDVFERDPDGMARVASIRFEQAQACAIIQAGPDDQTVPYGGSVTLTVTVAAGASVEWFQGAVGDTSNPAGTGASLLLENVTEGGIYWCRARLTTDGCEDRSRTATVTVEQDLCEMAVTIEAFPSQVAEGQPFQLRAPTGPAGTSYSWYRGTEPLATTTTPVYDVTGGIAAPTPYSVVMEKDLCTMSSDELVMTPCLMKRAITVDAANEGTTATLSVVPDQPDVTYQWYEGTSHQDLSSPRGNGPVISVAINGATHFWLRMTRVCDGVTVTLDSDIVPVDFTCMPKVFVHPVPASKSTTVGAVSATVTAGGQGPLFVQWYERPDTGPDVALTEKLRAAEGETYTWTYQTGDRYSKLVFAKIWQEEMGPISSDTVRLSISPTPQQIASSSPELTLLQPTQWTTLFVTMDPPAGPAHEYTYKWYADDGTRKGVSLGHTMASMAVSGATMSYWVVIEGVHNRNTAQQHTQVTVSPRMVVKRSASCELTPLRIEQSLDKICLGTGLTESPLVTFRAYIDSHDVTYHWYPGQSGDTRNDELETTPGKPWEVQVSGSTVQKVWLRVIHECGAVVDSPTLTFTRGDCTPLIIDQTLAPVEAEWGGDAFVEFEPLDLPGTQYLWFEEGQNGGSDTWLSEATGPTLHLQNVTKSARYWVNVRTANCTNSGTNTYPTLVRVGSAPGMTPPAWVTEVWTDADATAGKTLTATTAGGVRYQWFRGAILDQSHPVADSANSTFTTPIHTADTQYWVRVHGSGGKFLDSPTITVKVCNPPDKLTPAQQALLVLNHEVMSGQDTTLFVPITEPPTGSRFTYQWYRLDGTTEQPLADYDAQMVVRPTATTKYRLRISTMCPTERSEAWDFTVTVCTPPNITTQAAAAPAVIFPGSSSTLSVAATSTSGGTLTYQWYVGTPGQTGTPIANATSNTVNVSPTADTTYWVRVTRGACSINSAAVTVSMCSYPQSVTLPPVNVAYGQSATLQFPLLYPLNENKFIRWYKGATGDTSTPVQYAASAPSLNHTTNELTASEQYWLEFVHLGCVTRSNTITVSVCKPTITGQPSGTTIASGANATLTVTTTPIAGQSYQWYTGTPGNTANPVANGIGASLTVSPAATTSYWVRVKGSCTPDVVVDSAAATITVCNPPVINSVSANQSIRAGIQTAVSVTATGSNLTYQWYVGTSPSTTNPIYNATSSIHYVTPTSTTSYWCRVTSEGLCPANSATTTVNVCNPPTITQQPSAVPTRIFPGATSTLSVTASGTNTYQWYVGTSGNTSTPVAGGTTASITVSPTVETSYWVRVTTSVCTTDSAAITVLMCSYPQSVTIPATVNIAHGQSTTLQFPTMTPLNEHKYIRWYKGAAGDTSTLVHYSASAPSLNYTTPALTATTQYWLEFEHLGCVTRSNTITVNVCRPTITSQPSGTTVANGTTVTLSVGTTPIVGQTYQWYTGTPGNTTNPAANGTGASLTVTPSTTTSYWVRVKGPCTPEAVVDSAAATITVCNPPSITAVSADRSIRSGTQIAVSVTATGSNLTYQWYVGASGTTTSPIANSNSYLHYVTPASTTSYWCRVTSENLCSSNSATTTVNVCNPPTITQQPSAVPTRIFPGAASTLSVTASGSNTYQWYVGTPGNTSTPIAGATTASITVTPTVDTTYWVRVTTSVCTTDSAGVTVSICTYPQSVTLPANVNIAYGQTATLQFPMMTPLSEHKYIRWYKGAAGDTSNLVHYSASAPSLNYTTPALTATTQYWLEFEHLGCVTRSNTITVRVCQPAITSQPSSTTVTNGTTVTLNVGTTAIAGQTYQWYKGAVGNTSTPMANGTGASLTFTATATSSYWVRVKGPCSPEASVDSAAATITVCNAPVISAVSPNQSIRSGIQTAVSVTATGSNLTYQWYVGASGTTTSPIANSNSYLHYVTPTSTTSYWCRVTSEGLCSVNSATTTVNVCNPPTITQQPAATPARVFPGATSTLTVAASGSNTYQWYVGTTGTTSSPIAGATTASITVSPTVQTSYWVRVTTSVCTTDSATVTVSICDYAPTVTLPATYDIVHGGSVTIPFPTMYPLNEPKNIRWYKGPAGNRTTLVSSANSATGLNLPTGSLTQDTQYWMEFDHNGCLTTSTATTVRVCRPTITAHPQNATILNGNSHTLTVGTTGAPLTYQWYIGESGVTSQPVAGGTSASLTVSPSATTTYWVRATGCGGVAADSTTATVTVCDGPTITSIVAAGEYNIGRPGSVIVTATGTSLSYQWYKGQSGDTSQPVAGGVAATYSFTTSVSTYYWVRVTSACNNVSANSNAVLYSVMPNITAHPADVTVPRGTKATLSVTATGTYLSYQWYQGSSGTLIPGATSPTYTTPNLTTGTPEYFCIVKSGTVTKNSLHAFVTLCDGPTIQSFTTFYSAPPTYGVRVTIPSSQYSLVRYHWYRGVPGDTTQSTYIGEGNRDYYFNATTPATYWVRVAFTDNSCHSDSAGITKP